MIVHVCAALSVIGLVLLQHGKGADMGAAFGSGASQTIFGSRGSGSFLLKVTIGFVILFFATSIALNRMAVKAVKAERQMDTVIPMPIAPASAPVTPNSIPK